MADKAKAAEAKAKGNSEFQARRHGFWDGFGAEMSRFGARSSCFQAQMRRFSSWSQAKNYKEAIKHFSEAIKHDPSDHVFFSNRSACYASLEEYDKALEDGKECVRLKPDWPKGYTRKARPRLAYGAAI